MAAVAQRLAGEGIPIEEYPMTVGNLTAATSNLFDLINSGRLLLYSDAGMRQAISHAIIVESARGWRLDKLKQAHKIDVVVALSLAALAAVRGQDSHLAIYTSYDWVMGNPLDPPAAVQSATAAAEALGAARAATHASGREVRTHTIESPSIGPPVTAMWRSPYWR